MVLSSTPTKKRKLPPPPSTSYSGAFSLVHSALLNSLYSEELDGVQPAPAVVSSSPPSSSSSSSSSSSPSTVISAIPQFITYKTSIHENRKVRSYPLWRHVFSTVPEQPPRTARKDAPGRTRRLIQIWLSKTPHTMELRPVQILPFF